MTGQDVRVQVGRGLGAVVVRAEASACEAETQWVLAAQLWLAAATVSEDGADRRNALRCLQIVAPPTEESVSLEAKTVLQVRRPPPLE